jgi:GntR family transcriptional regulator
LGREKPCPPRAAELRINPNTVARAYRELEREGVIRTVPGGGTFVADLTALSSRLLKAEKLRSLRPIARQFAIEGAQLRISDEDLHKLLDESLKSIKGDAAGKLQNSPNQGKINDRRRSTNHSLVKTFGKLWFCHPGRRRPLAQRA